MSTSLQGITIREATIQDAEQLAEIAAATFVETFASSNSEEDMKIFLEKTYGVKQQTVEIQDSRCLFLLLFKVWIQDTKCIGFSKLVFDTPPDVPIDTSMLIDDKNVLVDNVELSKCYLLKEYHGTGVADRLMSATLEAIPKIISSKNSDRIQDGKKTLVWLGVWEFNPRAIKFYTRYGFKQVGAHPFVLGNDVQNDWLMAKFA